MGEEVAEKAEKNPRLKLTFREKLMMDFSDAIKKADVTAEQRMTIVVIM